MKVSNKVFLSLGSNIGDRESNIAQAISAIEINRGIENINSASFYHTEPLYNKDQGFFINTVIGLETILKPFELLDLIKKIEFMLGRNKLRKKNMPRTIDIDILVHGESIMQTEELIIPHPNLIHRKFVLIPFDEIAPDYKIPLMKLTVHELLVNCVDDSFVGLHDMENKA
jgi:2-amino-4-hydroxy-6-hydroxymethyldihydropteridine diphosphokinase